MEKENTNSGSVYVTVDGHLNPVHVSMKGTGEEGFLEFMLGDVEKALKETDPAKFSEWAAVLLDQALLAEEGSLKDPSGFLKRLNALLLS